MLAFEKPPKLKVLNNVGFLRYQLLEVKSKCVKAEKLKLKARARFAVAETATCSWHIQFLKWQEQS